MDTINGFPFIRDDDHSNILLGSLFPQGLVNSLTDLQQKSNPTEGFTNYKWQYLKRSLDEVQNDFFKFVTPQVMGNVTVIQEPGTSITFNYKDFVIYTEKNGKEGYQPGEDVLLYTIKIFVSTQGEKIEQAYFECKPAQNEAAFFIEDNTGDISKAKLYAKFGSAVQKQILLDLDGNGYSKSYLKNIPGINDSIIRDLIEKGYAEQKTSITKDIVTVLCKAISFTAIPAKIIGWVCDAVGNFIINNFSVPEDLWDSQSPGYFLKKENVINALTINPELVNNISQQLAQTTAGKLYMATSPDSLHKITISVQTAMNNYIANYNAFVKTTFDKLYDTFEDFVTEKDKLYQISESFALLCGVWNGLVDFVGGIFVFVGFLGQFDYDVYSNLDAFLERFDSFCEAISENFWADFWHAITESYASMVSYIKKQDSDDLNWDKIAYITGYAIAFIATFFIPYADFAKPAELAMKLKKAIVPIDLLSDISTATVKAGKKAAATVLKLLDNIIALLAKGKQALVDFFKSIWEKIANWLLKNKKDILKRFILVNDATEFARRFTLNTARHINYGEIRIKKINPQLPKNDPARLLEEYSYVPTRTGKGGKNPFKKVNYQVIVSGMHNLNKFNRYVRLKGQLVVVGKLPTGEKVYKGVVEFFVKELNQWKPKDLPSTFFPKSWSEAKIRKVIEEASKNIYYRKGNLYQGITKQGINIEFRVNHATGEITTAYIIIL